jgi:RHS repeat-associated protein
MPLEKEVIQGGSVQSLTRNFLGGRGLEAITTTENSVTTTTYPLYDTHGNMVATLTKNASGTSWNVGNERSYDVWGGVRSGAATGGPKGRYCANLGHVQDDESGLIYMRARYYEPSTGRFISEDRELDGENWYTYGQNNPANAHDPSGNSAFSAVGGSVFWLIGMAYLSIGYLAAYSALTTLAPPVKKMYRKKAIIFLKQAVVFLAVSNAFVVPGEIDGVYAALMAHPTIRNVVTSIVTAMTQKPSGSGMKAVFAISAYSLLVFSFVIADWVQSFKDSE